MQQVSVPTSYFVKTASNDYTDPTVGFLREFLQNSRDARATEINLSVDDTPEGVLFVCRDNGCGMDRDTIENKLMALGETTKGEHDTGGFGVAKIIIFFAQRRYMIETQDLIVQGSGGRYTVERSARRVQGTIATVELNRDVIRGEARQLADRWRREIEKSHLKNIKVTLNGQPVEAAARPGNRLAEVEGIVIHRRKVKQPRSLASVRVRGLHMFDLWHQECGYEFTIELPGYSTQFLTTNRDGLRRHFSEALARFLNKVIGNRDYADKVKVHHYRGRASRLAPSIASMLERVNRALETIEAGQDVGAALQASLAETWAPEVVDQVIDVARNKGIDTPTGRKIQLVPHDLHGVPGALLQHHYYVETKGFSKVPKAWEAEHLTDRQIQLLELWAKICGLVMRDSGKPQPFDVGFLLVRDGERTLAKFMQRDDQKVLLLNPLAYGSERELPRGAARRTELIHYLVSLACHEVTHLLGQDYHDERFVIAEAELRRLAYKNIAEYLRYADEVVGAGVGTQGR